MKHGVLEIKGEEAVKDKEGSGVGILCIYRSSFLCLKLEFVLKEKGWAFLSDIVYKIYV